MSMELIPARPQHMAALGELIRTHGPNAWNWLPEDGVREHLSEIAQGHAHAVCRLALA
jgi:hypothetical protein